MTGADDREILIVDTIQKMRRMIRTVIGDLSDTFYQCSDGRQALCRLRPRTGRTGF